MNNSDTVLVLRTCNRDLQGYNNFKWVREGFISCPDFEPTAECGKGFHGLAKGEGNASYFSSDPDAVWQVVEVLQKDLISLGDKVKFPCCTVLYSGDRNTAVKMIKERHPEAACAYSVMSAGDSGTATAGDWGTATAGEYGTATTGDYGTAKVGNSGTAIVGHYGTATAGDRGTATAGNCGTATAGYSGAATAGDYGTATAGIYGTATAGDYGTAKAGACGTATAGNNGTATVENYGTAKAGDSGIIQIKYWDSVSQRMKIKTGYIGEGGLLANVAYKLNDKQKFVKA